MKYFQIIVILMLSSCVGTKNHNDDSGTPAEDAATQDTMVQKDIEDASVPTIDSGHEEEIDSDPEEEFELPGALCKPCQVNSDCKAGSGLCIMNLVRNETFCSIGCAETPCLNGFVCFPNLIDRSLSQCFPLDPEISCRDNYISSEELEN